MNIIKYIIYFVAVVLCQVLIFNNIDLIGYMDPYIYIIFLLYIPIRISRSNLLIIAFILGLCIDIFENSGGIHASASLVLAFLRPFSLRLVSRRQYADLEDMRIRDFGFLSILLYGLFGTFIHHFTLFMLESFGFSGFGTILLRTLYSTIFTIIFVLIVQLWNFRRRNT